MRYLLIASLVACGGERAQPASSDEQAPSTQRAAQTEAEHAETPVDEPRRNRSAGPRRARFTLVPVRPHAGGVNAIAPMGSRIVVASQDGTVAVVDSPSGHVRAARRVFLGPAYAVHPSADGKRILVLGTDEEHTESVDSAAVWDLELDAVWRAPSEAHGRGAMSPDGTRIVVEGSWSGTSISVIEVWGDVLHQTPIERVDHRRSQIAFSEDGSQIVVASKHVHRFDAATGRRLGTPWELATRGAVALRPPHVAIGMHDVTSVDIRNVESGEREHLVDVHVTGSTPQWSPDGSKLLVKSRRRSWRVYDTNSWEMLQEGPHSSLTSRYDFRTNTVGILSADEEAFTYTATAPDSEPVRFESDQARYAVAVFPSRGSHFFYSAGRDVYIGNVTRRRGRRLLRGRVHEPIVYSAYGVSPSGRGIRIWHHELELGTVDAPPTPATPASPRLSIPEEDAVVGKSRDGRRAVVVPDARDEEWKLVLLVAGEGEPTVLPNPNYEYSCDMNDQSEHWEESSFVWYCDASARFGPEGQVVVCGDAGCASYDPNGRRLGFMSEGHPEFVGEHLVVSKRDGSLSIAGPNLRTRMTIMRGRPGRTPVYQFNEDGSLIAAVRGAALVIHDVRANARKHAITLPAPTRVAPRFMGNEVQVRLGDAFIWYSIEDGSETRRVEIDDVRGLNEDATAAAYCNDDRLLHRVLAEAEPTDLGPCPPADVIKFDDARAWWTDGWIATLVRFSDGQRLHAGALPGRAPLRYAYTPEGKVWVSDPARLAALRARTGPILEAEITELTEDDLTATLVEDFMTDEAL